MRIVSFSLVVPFRGIPHAGGEFYLRHVETLLELGHRVVIVAPETESNLTALTRARPDVPVLLVPVRARSAAMRLGDRVSKLMLPHGMTPSTRSSIRSNSAVLSALREAQLVEAQWEEMSFALSAVSPRVPTLLVAHDVPSQRERRWLRAAWEIRSPKKIVWRTWRTFIVSITERRSLDRATVLVVLSAKDAELAMRVTKHTQVAVIDPPLWDGSAGARRDPTRRQSREAIFVAAFSRRENVEAGVWLLERVWPHVLARLPDARLRLVGADPPSDLVRRASEIPGVVVTGYVDDLDEYYDRAAVALIPLLSGAGVKFKTIDALVRDVPVVSTSIGAEGILDERDRVPFPVRDDPLAFADEVLRVLRSDDQSSSGAWARARYGRERFAQRLDELLGAASSSRMLGRRGIALNEGRGQADQL